MSNLSLQRKTAARMAAIQYLYQNAITRDEQPVEKYIASVKEQLVGNKPEQKLQMGTSVEPHYPLLEALISGALQRQTDINAKLDDSLNEDWTRERMSPLLVALLQCALFELCFYKDVKGGIITDEYTKLARSFFDDKEVNFVHGLLAKISQNYEK